MSANKKLIVIIILLMLLGASVGASMVFIFIDNDLVTGRYCLVVNLFIGVLIMLVPEEKNDGEWTAK